jgi:Zn-dependent M28 family amino/carboxypeptidase
LRLAGQIGERNVWHPHALGAAADYIHAAFDRPYVVAEQTFPWDGHSIRNVEAEHKGTRPGEVVVVGAHYDTVPGSPGGNDNGSGVAALLEIARLLAPTVPQRTLRFVAFANEEPPFFETGEMGSQHYARRCRARGENVAAMLSLETIGYYRDEPGTQQYPMFLGPFYPPTGNFLAFVGNGRSRALVRRAITEFRRTTAFPSEGIAAPSWIPGIGWSDHAAFWQEGYPAVMVTDTALFRYPQYHTAGDTPDLLDYERLARVTAGLARVVAALLGPR